MIGFPAPLVALVAATAFAAGFYAGYKIGKGEGDAALVKMYQAGVKASAKKQEKVNEYAAEIADLRERPPRIVRVCPTPKLPATSGGSDAPGPSESPERDLGPLLREALDELIRCNALREAVK